MKINPKELELKALSSPKPAKEAKAEASTGGDFQLAIEKSLQKIEGLTMKIKDRVQSPTQKMNTDGIIGDVEQARQILDELTQTFHQINLGKLGQATSAANLDKGIEKYEQAKDFKKS